jgi:hypothetical protein
MTQKTTILKEVNVTYGGYQISGFGAGTFVSIEYDEDQIEIVKGVGHATALIKDNCHSYGQRNTRINRGII